MKFPNFLRALGLALVFAAPQPGAMLFAQEAVNEAPPALSPPLHTITVGGQDIVVPNPEGFERADGIFPGYDGIIEGYIAASNRLLVNFLIPDDIALLRQEEAPPAERSFNLQVLRQVESRAFGPSDTRKLLTEAKREITKQKDQIEKLADAPIKAGNENLKETLDADVELSLSGTTILGFFGESDSALGFSIVTNVTVDGETDRVISSAMMRAVNGRLLYFYATAPFAGKADREWAEAKVKAWSEATEAANPIAANTKAFGPLSALVGNDRSALIGGVVGAVVAVFTVLFVAKRGKKN